MRKRIVEGRRRRLKPSMRRQFMGTAALALSVMGLASNAAYGENTSSVIIIV